MCKKTDHSTQGFSFSWECKGSNMNKIDAYNFPYLSVIKNLKMPDCPKKKRRKSPQNVLLTSSSPVSGQSSCHERAGGRFLLLRAEWHTHPLLFKHDFRFLPF